MTPRPQATRHAKQAKALLRETLDALGELSGRKAAETAGIGYATLHTQGTLDRPNLPRPATLRAIASYLDAHAKTLARLARRLAAHARTLEQEQAAEPR